MDGGMVRCKWKPEQKDGRLQGVEGSSTVVVGTRSRGVLVLWELGSLVSCKAKQCKWFSASPRPSSMVDHGWGFCLRSQMVRRG